MSEGRFQSEPEPDDPNRGFLYASENTGTVTVTVTATVDGRRVSDSVEIAVRGTALKVRINCTPSGTIILHALDTVHCTASVEGAIDEPTWWVSGGRFDAETGILTMPESPQTVEIFVSARAVGRSISSGTRYHVVPREPVRQRAVVDLPDEEEGHQVHVLYVLARDAVDEALDTNSIIDRSVVSWNEWFADQAGGRRMRLDRAGGTLDVTFVRLDRTDGEMRAAGDLLGEIEAELIIKGFHAPNKIYLVHYDSGIIGPASIGGICGHALDTIGVVHISEGCGFPQSVTALDLVDLVSLHEIVHVLGFVPECAPHQSESRHVADSVWDLMAAVYSGAPEDVRLDINRDDYFEADVPNCIDLADSAFLDPLPASPQLPPRLIPVEALESIACDQEGVLRSEPGAATGTIEFFNGFGAPINVYSLDGFGTRVYEATVSPFRRQLLAGSGPAVVTDETNQCLGIYRLPTGVDEGRAIVR